MAWPGGQAVARYILDNPACVRGRRVLDVGAGAGQAALAALLAGAAHVTANDTAAAALAACAANADANGLGDALRDGRLALDSTDLLADDTSAASAAAADARLAPYDVLMAGDMLYITTIAARAQRVLGGVARRGGEVLLGDPGRRAAAALREGDAAWALRRVASYEVVDADPDPLVEGTTRRAVDVWRTDGARA